MRWPQRPRRERDPRVRRTAAAGLGLAALLVAGALLGAGTRVQQVRLAYRLDALRDARGEVARTVRQLEIEVATLRAPGRVEARARALGLTAPARDQVRLAREYVPGGAGLATVERRTAMHVGIAPGP